MAERTLGVIGGSGLYELPGLEAVERVRMPTPFGDPSDEIVTGRLGGTRLLFLPRHGRGHRLLPSELPFRANVWALKSLGADCLLAVSAVGSLREQIVPGHVVVPDQFIDRTRGRQPESTFFGRGVVAHVQFADPFCPRLSAELVVAARSAGATVHDGGTYLCMEGPAFSTRAESHLYRSWGAQVIGMTNVQEAKLAREAEICFATLALATDYDCWHEAHEDVQIEEILKVIAANADLARRTVTALAPRLPEPVGCPCPRALEHAIITDRAVIPDAVKRDLAPIAGAVPVTGGRRVVVTGSVAFDYLMTFADRFLDVLVPDRMHRLSVSFRVDSMQRKRGGCAPNIAYSLARLGADPVIMATAGSDAREYRDWLAEAGIDVSLLRIFDDVFTASFFVTTDRDQNQVGTFYSGAMDRARDLSFHDLDAAAVAMAVIAPNDPEAMARYARECRTIAIPFMYDPSQQVAQLTGEELLAGVEGAAIFIGNEYEFGVIEKKTGLTESELLARVPVLIITRGGEGSTIALRGGTPETPDGARTIRVPPAAVEATELDPTGVGDAYRAGLLAARLAGLSWEVAGRVGSIAAVYALETIGPQPQPYSLEQFRARYEANFGTHDTAQLLRLGS